MARGRRIATPIPVQEPGCGARHSLQRCREQGGGLLHAEPEERRPVLRSELKADTAVDHRYGIRSYRLSYSTPVIRNMIIKNQGTALLAILHVSFVRAAVNCCFSISLNAPNFRPAILSRYFLTDFFPLALCIQPASLLLRQRNSPIPQLHKKNPIIMSR